MARFVGVGRGAASYLSSACGILAVVTCVLAVATMVTALCATHFRKRDKTPTSTNTRSSGGGSMDSPVFSFNSLKSAYKSLGRTAINSLSKKKLSPSRKRERSKEEEVEAYDRAGTEEGDFLWQKSILMGERCQPLDFSGLIVYDDKGNRLQHVPPRNPPKLNLFHLFSPGGRCKSPGGVRKH